MAATRLIAMHLNKGKTIAQCLKERTDYAKNPEKTDSGQLVSSYECKPESVEEDFLLSKGEYAHKTGRKNHNDVIAYQIRQSFKPGEITPEEANRIGYETAMRWTKGNHAFIVATHIDREHIHNHIIYDSVNLSCDRKFRDFLLSGLSLQRLSDIICLENGLSVINRRSPDRKKRENPYKDKKSFRDVIRIAIDECLEKKPKSLDELLGFLRDKGYEIKIGKHIAVRGGDQQRFIRLRSLGEGYSEADLEAIISGKPEMKVEMILDIQDMIKKGKGPGYERWAKVFNIKQMAKTLLFLEENGIVGYDELAKLAGDASQRFSEICKKQKSLETQISDIIALKKHIINYSKTRDIYAEYRKSGYSKKFFEAHRDDILLCKAAKDAFSKIKGNIPKIKELNAQLDKLFTEKRETYSEYRKAKQEMKDLQNAKYNLDRFMENSENPKTAEKQKTEEQTL